MNTANDDGRQTPLGKAIKVRAAQKGMKLKDVAQAAGMPNNTYISQIMRGNKKNSKYISVIEQILDISLEKYAV